MRSFLAFLLVTLSAISAAGQFAVSPIRVDFGAADKSQAITVSNQGDQPLRIALELKRWTQDAGGEDRYTLAPDELIFFPRQFEIPPQQKQIIRVGRKTPANAQEQAYRLFINEQPSLNTEDAHGNVSMVVSFGVPVFVHPVPANMALESSPIKVDNTQLEFELHNTGNRTQRLTRLQIGDSGAEVKQFDHWYLHPGVKRGYRVHIPPTACTSAQAQTIQIETDQQRISQSISIPASACKP
jgi:fimbrial chaperone protein